MLILNMLNDCPVNVDKNPDVTELEKFFLFMTKLSFDKESSQRLIAKDD